MITETSTTYGPPLLATLVVTKCRKVGRRRCRTREGGRSLRSRCVFPARICLACISHPLRTPRYRSSLRSGVKMGRRRFEPGRDSLRSPRWPSLASLARMRLRPPEDVTSWNKDAGKVGRRRCRTREDGRSLRSRCVFSARICLACISHPLRTPRCRSSLRSGVKMGRRRFELRLRPPEGRRIPSYPTGPHRIVTRSEI